MNKILIIADQELKIEKTFIENAIKDEVTLNSVNPDGVSIFVCGTPIPQEHWDWVALVGNCLQDLNVTVDIEIPLDDDPIGNVISAIMAVKEGQDTDEAIGE
jgi:hypothetical protein